MYSDSPQKLTYYLNKFKNEHTSNKRPPENIPQESIQTEIFFGNYGVLPKIFCNACIFSVKNKTSERVYYSNQKIFSFHDITISYTGLELRSSDDQLIWMSLIFISKYKNFGDWIEFNPHAICVAVGWHPTGQSYKRIHESLIRLKATAIKIELKNGEGYTFSMIEDVFWSKSGYKVKVGVALKVLFTKRDFARHDWEIYRKLTPIARRLSDYIFSHKQPFKLLQSTIYKLLGSETNSTVKFRQQIRNAITELKRFGLIEDGEVRKTGKEYIIHFIKKVD